MKILTVVGGDREGWDKSEILQTHLALLTPILNFPWDGTCILKSVSFSLTSRTHTRHIDEDMQHIVRDSTRRCQLDQALVLSLNVWLHSSPPFLITTSKSWIPPRGKRQKVEGIRPHPIPCPLQLITHSSQYHFGIQFNSKPTLPYPFY